MAPRHPAPWHLPEALVPKLNAVDAISPAFKLTKLNLFSPYRWSFWWRVAVLGFLTGEISSGGGGAPNFNFPSNFPPPQHRGGDQLSLLARPFPNFDPHLLWILIPALVVGVVILMLVFMYLASVCRFILLEAVLNGRVSIREAWGRWKDQGARFFGFQLVLQAIFLAILIVALVIFLMIIGVSSLKGLGGPPSDAKIAAFIGAFFLFFIFLFLLMIPYLIIFVLAKDFAVPVMALEGATFTEAWRRVWRMVKDETLSIAGYFGMKIVLTVGAGIIFGIIGFVVILIVLLPVGGLGVAGIFAGKAAGLDWNVYTITAVVCAAIVIFMLLMVVISLISVPVAIFFPSYALYFFAGRYKPLHDRLFPSPPPAPVAPPLAPEPPPEIPPTPVLG